MYQKTYKIKKAFIIALAVDVILLTLLLLLSLFFGGSAGESIVIAVITVPACLFLLEAASRKVLTGNQGIMLRKFFRKRELLWGDITQVGTVILRKRVYLLLTTIKGFHILSNAYADFHGFLREIMDHISGDKIDKDILKMIENPINKISDIVSAWFGAVFLVAIMVLKLITH